MLSIMPKISEISVGSQMERSRFGSVRLEYSGPPLEEVYFDRSKRISRSVLTNRFAALLLFSRSRGLGKGTENGKSHSSRLARFDRKMSFYFSLVSPTGLLPVGLA